MDTIVRPPDAPPGSMPAASRHWPRRVVVGVTLVAIAFLIVAITYLGQYQPLTVNGSGAAWVDPRFATWKGDFTPPFGDDFSHVVVRYEDGRTFRYGMTLRNEGSYAVTITGLGEPECEGCVFPLVFERAFIGPDGGQWRYDPRHAEPFQPFVLPAGAERFIVLEDRFDHCESHHPAGDRITFLTIRVQYRTWFLAHEEQLPMPYSLEVRMRGGCRQGMGSANQ